MVEKVVDDVGRESRLEQETYRIGGVSDAL